MLHWLGIEPSYSRPRVSDDNPYAEALFRTAKYRPEFLTKGFANLDTARQWAARFVHWYNNSTGTAASDTLPRHSVMPVTTAPCSPPATNFTKSPAVQPATLEWADPRLDTGRRRHPQSRAGHRHPGGNLRIQLSGSIGEPAFPSRPDNA